MQGYILNETGIVLTKILITVAIVGTWILLSLLYAWTSKKILTYVGKESLAIKKTWKTYALIIFISYLIVAIVSYMMGSIPLDSLDKNIRIYVIPIISTLIGIGLKLALMRKYIKDANNHTIEWKWLILIYIAYSVIIAILTLIVRLLVITGM